MFAMAVTGIPTSVDKITIADTTKKATDIMTAVITLHCTVIHKNYASQNSSKGTTMKSTITLEVMQIAEWNWVWVSSNFTTKQTAPKKHCFHRKPAKLQIN